MYFDHILFFLPLSLDPPHFPSVLNLVLFLSQGKKRKSAKQNGSHTHTKKKKKNMEFVLRWQLPPSMWAALECS